MNAELLQRVRREIERRPERFSVAHWAWARNSAEVVEWGCSPEGFKCCIAGHVLLLSGRSDERGLLCHGGLHNNDGSLYRRAAEALELTHAQMSELFFPSQWEDAFKEAYYLCGRGEEVAVCAAYIDYFLDKHAASTFFDVFDFPLAKGDPEAALSRPGTVVLTPATARKYFGESNPIGQALILPPKLYGEDQGRLLTVTGVLERVPMNSSLLNSLFRH